MLQDQVAAADWLRDVVSMSTNPDYAIVVFPRANHALFAAPSPKPSDWQRMSAIERYAPGYWPLPLQWLGDHVPASGPSEELR